MATCPNCTCVLPDNPVMVQNLTVCQNTDCARTVVVGDDGARLASDADVKVLSEAERSQLRKLRPAAWRENTKLRLAAIRGKSR